MQSHDLPVTAITCTGDRPESFAQCVKYMERQIRKPDQWIIIDDGEVAMENIPSWAEYYRLDYIPKTHTLPRNMRFSLDRVINDRVVIFEDDDYYSKHYINEITKPDRTLVGGDTIYAYHVPTGKYVKSDGVVGPAFAQTCFHKILIPYVKELSNGTIINMDVILWKNVKGITIHTPKPLLVSIKGMPGRMGHTTLHNSLFYMDVDDGEVQSWFDEEWAEEDMNFYLRYLVEKPKYTVSQRPPGVELFGNIMYVPGQVKHIMDLMDTMYVRRDYNRWTV